jgi:hypothetical protein
MFRDTPDLSIHRPKENPEYWLLSCCGKALNCIYKMALFSYVSGE